ncbi:hypothetical protein BDK51DRAFT_35137 [Blyttiomyces helicus]|uniref:Uncharacterized protein n=1 Tax=Blyttiomyces helicus TaxID=388810 RepID=A0A4P9W2R6_9FUNG|nr:hypothetical protein BDK51DRAFT_35137 [Blyttiomyces helicus]|eukprot:RKO86444.1 hypothetical protein BDK51DRAFT_35137 [Blyttiomyces helicus]
MEMKGDILDHGTKLTVGKKATVALKPYGFRIEVVCGISLLMNKRKEIIAWHRKAEQWFSKQKSRLATMFEKWKAKETVWTKASVIVYNNQSLLVMDGHLQLQLDAPADTSSLEGAHKMINSIQRCQVSSIEMMELLLLNQIPNSKIERGIERGNRFLKETTFGCYELRIADWLARSRVFRECPGFARFHRRRTLAWVVGPWRGTILSSPLPTPHRARAAESAEVAGLPDDGFLDIIGPLPEDSVEQLLSLPPQPLVTSNDVVMRSPSPSPRPRDEMAGFSASPSSPTHINFVPSGGAAPEHSPLRVSVDARHSGCSGSEKIELRAILLASQPRNAFAVMMHARGSGTFTSSRGAVAITSAPPLSSSAANFLKRTFTPFSVVMFDSKKSHYVFLDFHKSKKVGTAVRFKTNWKKIEGEYKAAVIAEYLARGSTHVLACAAVLRTYCRDFENQVTIMVKRQAELQGKVVLPESSLLLNGQSIPKQSLNKDGTARRPQMCQHCLQFKTGPNKVTHGISFCSDSAYSTSLKVSFPQPKNLFNSGGIRHQVADVLIAQLNDRDPVDEYETAFSEIVPGSFAT